MEVKRKKLVIDILNVEVMRVCSPTNILLNYNWHLDHTGNETAIDLGLQSIKKYWRCVAQVADEFSHLLDFFFIFTVFINETYGNYDPKIQLDKRLRFK